MKNPLFLKKFWVKETGQGYPFLPLVEEADGMTFDTVTVFCGDNGAGKSTFAKILATATDCVFVSQGKSGDQVFKEVQDCFGVSREGFPRRKFYFSAEDFVSYIRVMEEKKADALAAIAEIDRDPNMSDYAKTLAKGPHHETLQGFERYGELAECSHGEGFLAFFTARLAKDGLYIIDEPEAALSSENQYRLAYQIHQAATEMGCQFVICTHSPIIAAIPHAAIYEIKDGKMESKEWDEVEDVAFTKLFLSRKDKMFE